MSGPIYQIHTERLAQFYDAAGQLGLTFDEHEVFAAPVQERWQTRWPADESKKRDWDLGRIHHFVLELRAGKAVDPIELDNDCTWETIGPPIICDGHHRFIAALLAGIATIPATYGGRVDILNYLTGKRKTPPKDLLE